MVDGTFKSAVGPDRGQLYPLRKGFLDSPLYGRSLPAYDTGRATDFALNALCRQVAGFLLRTGITWARRWIASGRNLTDAASRLANLGLLRPGEVLTGNRLLRLDAPRNA